MATLKELYLLDKRGVKAAEGTGDEILLGEVMPIDDEAKIPAGRKMLRKYAKDKLAALGAKDYKLFVGVNRLVEIDGMPLMFWRAYVPKGGYDASKVEPVGAVEPEGIKEMRQGFEEGVKKYCLKGEYI